uniref:Uncharacterized protein n=1 Tax=Anopheles minimus TaxID=112268 RepID=A0A182WKT6_9DIPT
MLIIRGYSGLSVFFWLRPHRSKVKVQLNDRSGVQLSMLFTIRLGLAVWTSSTCQYWFAGEGRGCDRSTPPETTASDSNKIVVDEGLKW